MERTTPASRYHRAIFRDVVCNNKRKRLRGIRGILSSERISNERNTCAIRGKRTPSSSALLEHDREQRTYMRIIPPREFARELVCERRTDERRQVSLSFCLLSLFHIEGGNFNRPVSTDATQRATYRSTTGSREACWASRGSRRRKRILQFRFKLGAPVVEYKGTRKSLETFVRMLCGITYFLRQDVRDGMKRVRYDCRGIMNSMVL